LIHAPQRSPPTNELCQYTPHGLLRTYRPAPLAKTLKFGTKRDYLSVAFVIFVSFVVILAAS